MKIPREIPVKETVQTNNFIKMRYKDINTIFIQSRQNKLFPVNIVIKGQRWLTLNVKPEQKYRFNQQNMEDPMETHVQQLLDIIQYVLIVLIIVMSYVKHAKEKPTVSIMEQMMSAVIHVVVSKNIQ